MKNVNRAGKSPNGISTSGKPADKKRKKINSSRSGENKFDVKPSINFRALLESTQDIIWAVDEKGIFTYISPKVKKILGYYPDEIIGKPPFFLTPDGKSDKGIKLFMDALKKRKVFRKIESSSFNRKGEHLYFEISGSPVYGPGGKFAGFQGFSHDVTDRVRAENELRKNEKIRSTLIKTSPDGISIASLDGNLQYASDKALHMFGYKNMKDVIGINIFEFLDEKYRDKANKHLQNIFKGIYFGFSDYLALRKDGTKFWCEINAEILRDEDGKPISLFFIQRDITEKKKTEEQLVVNNFALNSSLSAIGLADLDGCITYVNDAYLKFGGFKSRKEILGKHISDFVKDKAQLKILMDSLKSSGKFSGEGEMTKKDGSKIYLYQNVNYVKSETGEPICIMASFMDITAKKLAELAIIESEEKHRTLYEKMTQGVIYHDSAGRIISANPSAMRILGITFDRMKGKRTKGKGWKTIKEDGTILTDDEQPVIVSLKSGKQSKAVIGLYNPDIKKYIWINVISVPQFRQGEKKPYQVITTIEDVSAQIDNKKLQAKLNEQIKVYAAQLEQEVKSRTAEIESLMSFNSAIIDNADIAIVSTDRNGTIVTFNHAAEHMLGYKSENVTGKMSVMKLYDEQIIKRSFNELGLGAYKRAGFKYENYMTNVLKKRPGNFEWSLKTKEGNNVPVLLSLKMLRDSKNEIIGYVGVGVDISRRIEAEKALRESEERFQKMFHEHEAVMLLVDPVNGEIVEANKSAARFYGYDFSVKGKYGINNLNVLSKEQIAEEMTRAAAQRYNYFVFPHKLASGEIRTVEVHSSPVEINGRKLLFSVIHDITERKFAEEALKKSENENRAIIRAVPDMLFRIHRDGTYLETYTSDQSAFYVPPELFLGKKIDEVLPEFHAALALGALYKAFVTSDIVAYEYELPIKGVSRYFENRIIAISDTEALSIIRDISDRKKTEAALLESESKYRNLHESMMDGYVMIDLDGTILEFNESYRKLTGYSEKELKNLNFRVLTPPKWYEMEDKIINEQVIKRGYSDVFEKEYIRKDGSLCSIEISAFLLRDNSGGKDRAWAIVRDISERKKIEAALRLQSEAFESFVNPVVITDINANIQWVNPAFTKLTGYTKEEAIGKNTSILKSGMHDIAFYMHMWDTILSGHYWTGEMINKRKDGSLYYEENTITPVKDLSGNIVNFIAVKNDITGKKEMEKALRESDERWQFALEGSGDGVWDWNTETNKIYVSPQWKRTLGYEEQESISELADITKLLHSGDRDVMINKLNEYSRNKTDLLTNEHRMLCKDGTYKWVLIRGKGVEKNSIGHFTRIIGTQSDITQRKMAEDQLLKNLDKEKELNELKSRFISMASHEFRTPLASILLISDALDSYWKDFSPEQVKTKLQNIKERVIHLTEIVNDVLHLSKIQSGKIEFSPERIELVEECRKSIDGFNDDASLANKIEFNCSRSSLHIYMDQRLINQILNNLISNAIKYSPVSPRVKINLEESDDEIILSVSDNGIGIPENDKKYIFDAFYRASNAKLIQGNGLGLNIIKESLNTQGGDITFKSQAEKGTTFYVHLPKEIFLYKNN